jgi:hypothetical protein
LPRLNRLDFRGAIHIVHVRGREHLNIFFAPEVLARVGAERWRGAPHVLQFLRLLNACCLDCGAQLFGYCVEPNEVAFVVRSMGAALEACMQRFGGRYSRYLHGQGALSKELCPFASRYESKVVAPEYLPHALRRVHGRAVVAGLVRKAIDYPFSSAAAYLGERGVVTVESDALWRALEEKGLFGLRGYKEFMERAESPYVGELFEKGAKADERVVGDRAFVVLARDAAGHPREPPSQEALIQAVATVLKMESAQLFGSSHEAVVGRALVASLALRYRSASLREVGMWFSVSGAALGRAARRYRREKRELFDRPEFPGIEAWEER